MMNIVIDVGNTLTKYAVYDNNDILFTGIGIYDLINTINAFKSTNEVKCIISSSGKLDEYLKNMLEEEFDNMMSMNYTLKFPVNINYKTLPTLGMDRLASVVGAYKKYPNEDVMIIDMGTALTFDFLIGGKEYLGGNISPGLNLRFRALHEYTDKLPLVEADINITLIGDSTETAIKNGVMNGIIFEINSYIRAFKDKYPNGKVLFTGGEISSIEEKIDEGEWVEHLCFEGLNEIINFNS